jgi:ribosomal protein L35
MDEKDELSLPSMKTNRKVKKRFKKNINNSNIVKVKSDKGGHSEED